MINNENLKIIQQATPMADLQPVSSHTLLGGGIATIATIAAVVYAMKRHQAKQPVSNDSPNKFANENITASFVAAVPTLTRELNLEVATATQTETFTRSSSRVLFWGLVDLGTNVVQVRVPVTYRYHIGLRERWDLKVENNKVVVTAPVLRASLPPAIHSDQIERLSLRGWARGSTRQLLQDLEKQLTPILAEHACSPKQLDHVRHACRLSVAEFVRLWLEYEGQWQADRLTSIQVRFADETVLPSEPTIKFLG